MRIRSSTLRRLHNGAASPVLLLVSISQSLSGTPRWGVNPEPGCDRCERSIPVSARGWRFTGATPTRGFVVFRSPHPGWGGEESDPSLPVLAMDRRRIGAVAIHSGSPLLASGGTPVAP